MPSWGKFNDNDFEPICLKDRYFEPIKLHFVEAEN